MVNTRLKRKRRGTRNMLKVTKKMLLNLVKKLTRKNKHRKQRGG